MRQTFSIIWLSSPANVDASIKAAFLVSRAGCIGFADADISRHKVAGSEIPFRCRTCAGFWRRRLLRRRLRAGVAAAVVAAFPTAAASVVVSRGALHDANASHAGFDLWTSAVFHDRTAWRREKGNNVVVIIIEFSQHHPQGCMGAICIGMSRADRSPKNFVC